MKELCLLVVVLFCVFLVEFGMIAQRPTYSEVLEALKSRDRILLDLKDKIDGPSHE